MTDTARRLTRQRDCDLATSHDLEVLDVRRIPYEIVETDGGGTTLRFSSSDLKELSLALGHRRLTWCAAC